MGYIALTHAKSKHQANGGVDTPPLLSVGWFSGGSGEFFCSLR